MIIMAMGTKFYQIKETKTMNTMTCRQADKLIASGELVTLYHFKFQETFTAVITSRNRFSIYFKYGDDSGRCGLIARDEVQAVAAPAAPAVIAPPANTTPIGYAYGSGSRFE